jgi:hypothetical protein
MKRSRFDQAAGNFVAPLPSPRVEIVETEVERVLPAPPSTVLLPQAGYQDRALGFRIAAMPLACVVGAVAALVAIVGWSVPVLSLLTLLAALAGFSVVWLIAFAIHTFVSPDGSVFASVVLAWLYLRSEQKERFRRYREVRRHDRE